ncbi:sigma-70 RNA polymerase sigma factor region 4 domain-containing protein [Alkalibacter mobilis]|uniref:hypothetical protein n=1 Tax=Alkalibacter mobilis TaxID=2787712 RepID=UPI00189F27BB|nr:hypothetical protein [Alkalibacter mobilis]MBF7097592.1 hypothetical protein [Alkalibacter mobilis]
MTSDKYRQTERVLYDYKFIKGYVELRKQDLQELEYEGVKALQYSETMSGSGEISDPVAREFEIIEKQRFLLKKAIAEKELIIKKIDYALHILSDLERNIVEMKYFKGIRNYDIADCLGYSKKQIERINKSTIYNISSMIWID